MPLVRTDVRERARLRLNEENRAKRAFDTIYELAARHLAESKVMELQALRALLLHAIRNQHVTFNASVRPHRAPFSESIARPKLQRRQEFPSMFPPLSLRHH